jgi:hypothetical protein
MAVYAIADLDLVGANLGILEAITLVPTSISRLPPASRETYRR